MALGGLARLAAAVGQPRVAARLLGAVGALPERAPVIVALEYRHELERAADLARAALGEETFRATAAGGADTPLPRLIAEALAWVGSLPAAEPDDRAPAAHRSAAPAAPGNLSPREIEVLRLIARGRSNREIADALVISPNTVARHVSNIFAKIGAANRTEAAAYAHRRGLAP